MNEDIKGLLGKAFGPEPPLSLDREAIVRRGRRQVRVRRLAASAGVAAAVVAVVLGAALLSNRPGGGADLTPALPASTTPPPVSTTPSDLAPAGPELPLTTTPAQAVPATERHAAELTKLLSGARVVPGSFNVLPAEPDSKPLEFRFSATGYRTTAQLADGRGQGILIIAVTPGSSAPKCPPHPSCTELKDAGVAMVARTDRNDSGTVEYSVLALRPDGTSLTLIANNLASLRLDETRTTRPEPPVNLAQLRAIATLPGLTYG